MLRINKVAKAISSSQKHGLSGRLQEDERGRTTTLYRIFLYLSSKALMYSVMAHVPIGVVYNRKRAQHTILLYADDTHDTKSIIEIFS